MSSGLYIYIDYISILYVSSGLHIYIYIDYISILYVSSGLHIYIYIDYISILYVSSDKMTPIGSGARCSSVVRALAHGAMGRRIDPSWGGPIELFLIPARKEGNVLFNDALNTFYLWLHMLHTVTVASHIW